MLQEINESRLWEAQGKYTLDFNLKRTNVWDVFILVSSDLAAHLSMIRYS